MDYQVVVVLKTTERFQVISSNGSSFLNKTQKKEFDMRRANWGTELEIYLGNKKTIAVPKDNIAYIEVTEI